MFEELKKLGDKAKEAISSTVVLVGDLNGDGKVDEEDARIAAEWAKKTASSVGEEASKLGKSAINSDMAKDAATGAAVGAAIASVVPFIGTIAGAAAGATAGVYKNITRTSPNNSTEHNSTLDIHAELIKLDDLRQRKIISEDEFESEKKKLMRARP